MNLFVGNLSWDCTQQDVEAAFAGFGQVSSVKIITDRETGKPRGFAFVDMPNDTEAQNAIKNLHGREFKGRNLNVNEARPRENSRPSSGRGGGGGGGGGGGRW